MQARFPGKPRVLAARSSRKRTSTVHWAAQYSLLRATQAAEAAALTLFELFRRGVPVRAGDCVANAHNDVPRKIRRQTSVRMTQYATYLTASVMSL